MKRALAALLLLGMAALPARGSAAGTVYGSSQVKYTVNATASVSIAVNYDPTTGSIKNAVAGTILGSVAANCSAAVAEGTNATLTFGGITPAAAGYTGCYYKNAISVGVQSNDTAGVKIMEYLDVTPAGTATCVFPLGTANTLTALPAASGAAGNPAAYTAGACQSVNGITGNLLAALGAATAGTGFGGAGVPAGVTTDVTATPTATIYTAGGFQLFLGGSLAGLSSLAYKYVGQDVQLNVSSAASSGAATSVITVAVIPQ
jgi:hypothetical protein